MEGGVALEHADAAAPLSAAAPPAAARHPLGATAWYRALPQPVRARFGLELIASFARIGLQFENALQRGLLEYAFRLPNGAPEYRYVMHEVIEEGQHSLMLQFREAHASAAAAALRVGALRKPRELCLELGIAVAPFDRLWRRMGIRADPA